MTRREAVVMYVIQGWEDEGADEGADEGVDALYTLTLYVVVHLTLYTRNTVYCTV